MVDGNSNVEGFPQKTESSSEQLKAQFEQSARFGRAVINIARERDGQRLMPYFDLQRFAKEDVMAIRRRMQDESLSQQDVSEASRGSLALLLEGALQISEAQFQKGGPVREDLESLENMKKMIVGGIQFGRKIIEKGNGDIFANEVRKAFVRRQIDEKNLTNQQLSERGARAFNTANNRLSKGIDSISGYLGR